MNPKWALKKSLPGRRERAGRRTKDPKVDADHLAWVRSRPCAARECFPHGTPCYGEIQAHHPTGAGLALKAPDAEAIPLCRQHHHELHTVSGTFRGWLKARLKTWQRQRSDHYRRLGALRRTA